MCTSASGWTSEQTAVLIEVYQGEEVLYHVKSPDYHNKFARQNALERIVKSLNPIKSGVTVAQVKAKINVLRSRYTTELAKTRCKPSGTGTDHIYKVAFEFFENLKFLSDHVQARKGTLNQPLPKSSSSVLAGDLESESVSQDEAVSQESDADVSWVEEVETSEREFSKNKQLDDMPASSSSPSPAESTGRKRKKADGENFLKSAGTALQMLCSGTAPAADEWYNFGSTVAASIRNLSNRKLQIKCKHKILHAIIECEEEDM